MYKAQADRNSMELAQKNRELVDKISELEGIKRQYNGSISKLHNLEEKVKLLFNIT